MNKFFLESERLIIRPLEESDYDSWYTSFMNRGPSLTPFDDGILDMSMCDINWFKNLVNLQRKEWESDIVYIFGVFLKSGEHVGMLNIVTLQEQICNGENWDMFFIINFGVMAMHLSQSWHYLIVLMKNWVFIILKHRLLLGMNDRKSWLEDWD